MTAETPALREQEATLGEAPEHARTEQGWAFGRWRTPIRHPELGHRALRWLRLKEWHYTSVNCERVFLAFGLVQLGYAANVFLYLVDKERPSVAHQHVALAPLGWGLDFAPSSIEGESRWRRKGSEIRVAWQGREGRGAWEVRLDVPLGERRLRGGFRVEAADALALLYDLGEERPAYTHKAAGLRASGSVRFGDEAIDLAGGLATLDWTRSLATRETRWKWASFAGRVGEHDLGLNLSTEIYDDPKGASLENALWVDGRVHLLPAVSFEVPKLPAVEDWTIRSADGRVDLTFRPLGARAQHLDLKVIRSDFVQPYGLFRGRVLGHTIDEVFGVVEDHLSVW